MHAGERSQYEACSWLCRPSRHQREAATGGDYLSGYEEFVDAMDDIEAMARSGTDRLDRAEQRKPIVDRDPLFAGDVVGGDPLLRREWVVLWHGDIQRLVQQRGDAHTSRPWRRVVEAVCQDDVVVAGERRELVWATSSSARQSRG